MSRTSWIIVIATILIGAIIGFFFTWPQVSSAWQVFNQTGEAKKELNEINQKKEILTKF